jgi:LysR family transcriptional regulator for bpeEF and oprC
MDSLGGFTVFVKVAESRSFSAAAERLGMTPSGASRAVARLERRLGARLLDRTTRRVELTRDGIAFYERCRRILADIDEASSSMSRAGGTARGRLRVQLPVGFGKRVIVPALPRFVERHQEVVLDVELNDRGTDLAREHIDVAVRVGHIRDSRLAMRRLCHTRFVSCASPAYLKKHGEPRTPADLKNHRCMGYFIPQTGRYREWEFLVNAVERSRAVHGNLNINSGEALLDAMVAGGGIATVATFVVADAVKKGTLQIVLRDFIAKGPDISIIYLPAHRESPAVRAFVDFLVELIPADPPWDRIIESHTAPRGRTAHRASSK